MNAFCTIITKSHLSYATVLFQSIQKFKVDSRFVVYIVDGEAGAHIPSAGIEVLTVEDLATEPLAGEIRKKYYRQNLDKYRWSMKPVVIAKLLKSGCEKVVFLDSDLYFFDDPTFLLNELSTGTVLLSPHWRATNPSINERDFERNFYHGIYNGGFVGASYSGLEAMSWWAAVCLYKCEKKRSSGLYVDQAYLNMMPSLFEQVKVLRHRGCNVANWNRQECERTLNGNQVSINETFSIVFIHFAGDTIKGILNGEDPLLRPYLEAYNQHLKQLDNSIDLLKQKKKWFFF